MCKMRAFTELWDEIGRDRYGITDEKHRRFRYGVQVNSLGLTEQQPENNVYRILIEMLAVVLSKNARARAVQFRPGTRRWGCRGPGTSNGRCACSRSWPTKPTCSTMATSSMARTEIERKVEALKAEARAELEKGAWASAAAPRKRPSPT